jgi:phosphopantothenoylcysteine decarboxylase/phosphopantothenate--cysteine ligase
MRQAVMKHLGESTMIVKAAAVADYHRANPPAKKEKKTAARLSLELDPTPDILAELGKKKGDRLLVGFAAETDNLIAEARRKLETKNCDMIVANLVAPQSATQGAEEDGVGFDSDENEVVLVMHSGESIPVRRAAKRLIARRIFDEMIKLRLVMHAGK